MKNDQQHDQGAVQQTSTPHHQPQQPQPVAYDQYGRPLYAAPPQPFYQRPHHQSAEQATQPVQPQVQQSHDPKQLAHDPHYYERGTSSHVTATHAGQFEGHNFDPRTRAQYSNEPHVVHTNRPYEPVVPQVSEELEAKHQESLKKFPFLNLSKGEYVIMYLHRHPIGLLIPSSITVLIIAFAIALMVGYPMTVDMTNPPIPMLHVVFISLCLVLLAAIGGYLAVWIYLRNMFFLTNESIIQEIQISLFTRREQTVSLGSIEDASFIRSGLIATLFDYGTVRLSTEGEETTYRFHYVARPKEQVAILNNAVEAFKNGRPVGDIH